MNKRGGRKLALLAVLSAFGVLAILRSVQAQERPGSAASAAEAERAFSRLSARVGHVAAFLAYFADDVVTFQPTPSTGKERLREAAARMPVPPAVKLDWEPWFADAADSGDLAYTTGPSVFTDAATGKVLRTGWYFSIWKHDVNGWRVAADIGTEAPAAGPLRPREVEFATPSGSSARPRSREDVLALERQLARAIADAGLAKAYEPYLAPTSRVHRDGVPPVVGPTAILAFLGGQPKSIGCRAVDAGVSQAGDLAYSVGECEAAGATPAKSGFLRAWKSGPRGWLLAADVVTR